MKQTYRDYFNGKPSAALAAMVLGLSMPEEKRGFRIDMGTYGEKHGDVCFGCAATATIRGCLLNPIDPELISGIKNRAKATGAEYEDESKFESAMDDARCGDLGDLFHYMGLDTGDIPTKFLQPNFVLYTRTFREELPKVRAHIKKLKNAGF